MLTGPNPPPCSFCSLFQVILNRLIGSISHRPVLASLPVISGQHDHLQTLALELSDRFMAVWAQWVADTEQPGELTAHRNQAAPSFGGRGGDL